MLSKIIEENELFNDYFYYHREAKLKDFTLRELRTLVSQIEGKVLQNMTT